MRPADYGILKPEVDWVNEIQSLVVPAHPHQHVHRVWEQALAWRAATLWANTHQKSYDQLEISDWGCGVGMLPAMFLAVGSHLDLFEPWVYGNESAFVHRQMTQVQSHFHKGSYSLGGLPLCEIGPDHDERYDISFCISTIEHIGEEEKAFRQLLKTVKPKGMVFLTMDFCGDGKPEAQYECAFMRCRMYTETLMRRLGQWASEAGFHYLGGQPDWQWSDESYMVHNYGFSSIALERS